MRPFWVMRRFWVIRRFWRLINQNCRLATRLVSDAAERALTPLERCGLTIHLMGCRSCRRYRRQIHIVDQVVTVRLKQEVEEAVLPAPARERIRERLGRSV